MTQICNYDTDMAKYILRILKAQPNVVCSWGFRSPYVVKNGVRFHVNGFLHRGWCEVMYDEGRDTFTFCTFGSDGRVLTVVEDVYFDNLVSVIDYHVETKNDKSEKYKKQVNDWLATV